MRKTLEYHVLGNVCMGGYDAWCLLLEVCLCCRVFNLFLAVESIFISCHVSTITGKKYSPTWGRPSIERAPIIFTWPDLSFFLEKGSVTCTKWTREESEPDWRRSRYVWIPLACRAYTISGQYNWVQSKHTLQQPNINGSLWIVLPGVQLRIYIRSWGYNDELFLFLEKVSCNLSDIRTALEEKQGRIWLL